ncbi:hypothetical protein [Kitasatospora griseola]|uniref:hypothetical protein n=1 Tax=Kitasatospora griseola TaxID=2064 RepID=UPI0016715A7F|nr:hypothetical protein [Kitasatospora griseola]GGQ54253.1 hypothetical protein GCM10010195_07130 [Kitasatospora griseola]
MGDYQDRPAMPGYGPAATGRPAGAPVGFIVVVVLFAVLGALVDALFSFGMLFATDSCGTGSPDGSAAVCNPAVWALTVTLPWAGLLATVVLASVGAIRARRRGRSPWRALPLAVAVYLLACGVAYLVVFGP